MANHQQAKKRNRQRIKRTARNRHIRTTMRSAVKQLRSHIDEGNGDEAKQALANAVQRLDKASTKGVLNRQTASRTISRLTIAVSKISPSA